MDDTTRDRLQSQACQDTCENGCDAGRQVTINVWDDLCLDCGRLGPVAIGDEDAA